MNRRLSILLAWGALLLLPRPTHAQVTPAAGYVPPDDTPTVKVGGLIFLDYTFTKQPKATDSDGNVVSANAFNLVRTYINVTGNFNHALSFRITPDISRETGSGSSLNGSLVFRLKYGYAQYSLDDWTGKWKGTWVRFGMQQHPFIDFQESVYRYRFQGTVFIERDGGIPSSDAGVSFHTNIPGNYGDVHVGVFNGEGYGKPEVNNEKGLMVRGTVRPMPAGKYSRGLRLTAFYTGDNYVRDGERTRLVSSVWFEHPHVNMGIDYLKMHDQTSARTASVEAQGYSFFVVPAFKEKGRGPEVLLRFDAYKPNTAVVGQQRKRLIVGAAYWFPHQGTITSCLLVDFEQVTFHNFSPTQPTQQKLMVHGLINF